mmetsp:Transcript_25377/g.41757  ORF Transcript_25377/g.41757 Transcript_25377/m.41757 type:complete len:225 (+) Transcript_25377:1692-2366(+)
MRERLTLKEPPLSLFCRMVTSSCTASFTAPYSVAWLCLSCPVTCDSSSPTRAHSLVKCFSTKGFVSSSASPTWPATHSCSRSITASWALRPSSATASNIGRRRSSKSIGQISSSFLLSARESFSIGRSITEMLSRSKRVFPSVSKALSSRLLGDNFSLTGIAGNLLGAEPGLEFDGDISCCQLDGDVPLSNITVGRSFLPPPGETALDPGEFMPVPRDLATSPS